MPTSIGIKLLEAAREGRTDFTNLIGNNRNDIDTKDADGNSPLHICIGLPSCVRALIQYGANIHTCNKAGMTPIHLAAKHDYVESLLQLIAHGAKINGHSTDQMPEVTDKSPLFLAIEEKSQPCVDMLLFCGADPTNTGLDQDKKEKQSMICHGYSEKKILFGRSWPKVPSEPFVNVMDKQGQTTLLKVHSSDFADGFELLCRREQEEYQKITYQCEQLIGKNDELVSDVYRYKVNMDCTCNITIAINRKDQDSLQRYNNFRMRHIGSSEPKSYDNISVGKGQVTVHGVKLLRRGKSAFLTFGIFAVEKEEKIFSAPGKQSTHSSTVEPKFKVTLPGSESSAPQEYDMRVKNVKQDTLETEGLKGTSDFCEINQVDKSESSGSHDNHNAYLAEVELPMCEIPKGCRPAVVHRSQDDNSNDPSCYHELDNVTVKQDRKTATVSNTGCGTFIVTALKGKITNLIKEKLRALYQLFAGKKAACVLMVLLKPPRLEASFYFYMRFILCLKEEKGAKTREYKDKGYTIEGDCTSVMEIKCKHTYYLRVVDPSDVRLDKCQVMPISFKGCESVSEQSHVHRTNNTVSFQIISVVFSKKEPVFGTSGFKNCKDITTLPITLETSEPVQIPEGSFLNDVFINKMSAMPEMLSDDCWFVIGLHLGLTTDVLSAFDDLREAKCKKLLKRWQSEYRNKGTSQLTLMFQAIQAAEMPEIKQELEEHVKHFKTTEPNLGEWCARHIKGGKVCDLPYLAACSPKTDLFAYKVAKEISPKFELMPEIGITWEEIEEERYKYPQKPRRSITQLLVKARRRVQNDHFIFLKKIVKGLKIREQIIALDNVKNCIQAWLDEDDISDAEARKVQFICGL